MNPENEAKVKEKDRHQSEHKTATRQKYITGAIYAGPREGRTGSRSPNRIGHSNARKGDVTQKSKLQMTGRHHAWPCG